MTIAPTHTGSAMVTYFTMEQTPGVSYFACEKLRAKFPVETCADMWRKANRGTIEERELRSACKNCPIGATHAGEPISSISPLRNTKLCGRCRRPSRRLVHKHLCVSCFNRQAEFLKGKNAKGCAPVRMRPLSPRTIGFQHGTVRSEIYLPLHVDTIEIAIAAVRDSTESVALGWDAGAQLREVAEALEQKVDA